MTMLWFKFPLLVVRKWDMSLNTAPAGGSHSASPAPNHPKDHQQELISGTLRQFVNVYVLQPICTEHMKDILIYCEYKYTKSHVISPVIFNSLLGFLFFCKVTFINILSIPSGTIWSCGQMSCDKWQIIYLKKSISLLKILVFYMDFYFFVKWHSSTNFLFHYWHHLVMWSNEL